MSIPAEPSLLQDEVQVFISEPCKLLSGRELMRADLVPQKAGEPLLF